MFNSFSISSSVLIRLSNISFNTITINDKINPKISPIAKLSNKLGDTFDAVPLAEDNTDTLSTFIMSGILSLNTFAISFATFSASFYFHFLHLHLKFETLLEL